MTSANKQVSVVISRDEPYIVSGDAPLTEEIIGANADGESMQWQRGKAYDAPAKYALCRCGQSAKAPFCDGTHARVGFDGTAFCSLPPILLCSRTKLKKRRGEPAWRKSTIARDAPRYPHSYWRDGFLSSLFLNSVTPLLASRPKPRGSICSGEDSGGDEAPDQLLARLVH